MELKEYYKILRTNVSVVIYTVLIAIVGVYAWSMKQSGNYNTSLILNISREETQSTADYRYDQFYRIQADEKFAETIQQWLKSPGIVSEIFEKSGIEQQEDKSLRQLSKSFGAEKLSPEVVEVRYSAASSDDAKKIGDAIGRAISDKTKSLNVEAKDPSWFSVSPSNLIILKNTQDLRINLSIAAAIGLFFGILFAFIKHYLSSDEE
jgi:capsular polysaccharide biosynthesis protein